MSSKLLGEWFWADRWTGSSGFLLPMDARGLYREMLTQCWRRGGYLPASPASIRRATGCSEAEWRRCWPKVRKYWTKTGDGKRIYNETQQGVIAKFLAKKKAMSERGKKGAIARWKGTSKAKGKGTSNAQAKQAPKLEQCPPPSPLKGGRGASPMPEGGLPDPRAGRSPSDKAFPVFVPGMGKLTVRYLREDHVEWRSDRNAWLPWPPTVEDLPQVTP